MYLSYTGYKTYKCPKNYWFGYISKPTLPILENRANSLYGTTVGYLFEWFYNERIWETTGVEQKLKDRVQVAYLKAVAKETRDGVVKWKPEDKKVKYASCDEMLADVHETIPRGIRNIRHHRLLGQDALAEVKLDQVVEEHTIGGRCDLLMRRIAPLRDKILLDGKGSKYRGMYVDALQLKWYAMLHRMKFGYMPDRLGFLFWRFEPHESMDWVDCSNNELDELQAHILGVIHEIVAGEALLAADPSSLSQAFPARPGDACRFCTYFQLCSEGQKFDSFKAPRPVGSGVEDVGL